ncbi:MAG: hypothetical protein ABSG86_01805 [Thermoguttaceae bacterium]
MRFQIRHIALCLLATALSAGAVLAAEPPLGWGPAPPAAAVPQGGADGAAPSPADLAAAAAKPPAAPARKNPPVVVEAEWYPFPYRTILLRYFDWPPVVKASAKPQAADPQSPIANP